MKVFVVKVLWRNDEDFGSYSSLFQTREKAEEQFKEEIKSMKIDYEIEDKDISFQKDNAEYRSDWYDYCDITLYEEEVK